MMDTLFTEMTMFWLNQYFLMAQWIFYVLQFDWLV